jgi:nitrile hydratase
MTNSQEAERLVCTLCSCYPWQLLGLPPSWYKDPAYRARVVKEPRAVLSEMGLDLADDAQWSYYEHWLGALEEC